MCETECIEPCGPLEVFLPIGPMRHEIQIRSMLRSVNQRFCENNFRGIKWWFQKRGQFVKHPGKQFQKLLLHGFVRADSFSWRACRCMMKWSNYRMLRKMIAASMPCPCPFCPKYFCSSALPIYYCLSILILIHHSNFQMISLPYFNIAMEAMAHS